MATTLPLIESAKRLAAYRAVDEHFPPNARSIGIGSGSTVVYVVERISLLPRERTDHVTFIPTGYQSRELIVKAGLRLGSIDMHTETLDVVFDGADEVDPYLNCIKGGGACLFQEKLVAISGRKLVVVADFRKLSPSLSTHYAPGVPIEVVPLAANYVLSRLSSLGSSAPTIRMGGAAKAGPCITDNGNFIIDAPFPDGFIPMASSSISPPRPLTLKSIVGVVEHGIFWAGDRKPVTAYFGMEDGTVSVRTQPHHHHS
ncbi:ribose-5-phosphate isomerase [Sphaerosporella brunnea]|uniref:Ribose-5-phosphate isomerase n=1 Tax=Sphaerosporella brunnea TaxID=1250544 RepID=A0A5J5F8V8_9PEZI|nr:ribose-5-phosphate isomerase [Sphaerosporella brunnea]